MESASERWIRQDVEGLAAQLSWHSRLLRRLYRSSLLAILIMRQIMEAMGPG